MDSEYVVLDDHAATVIQSSNQTDNPPPTSAAGVNGIRRISSGPAYPSIVDRLDIDLTVCKTNITGLETQAIQQASKLEWMQQELRMAREDRQELAETAKELKSQITELTTRLENSAISLKSLSNVCTFRAVDFHARSTISDSNNRICLPPRRLNLYPHHPLLRTHIQPQACSYRLRMSRGKPPMCPVPRYPLYPNLLPRIIHLTGISAKPAFRLPVPGESSPPPHPRTGRDFHLHHVVPWQRHDRSQVYIEAGGVVEENSA